MKFTVGIPTYNRYDHFLRDLVDLLSEYPEVERIIIVDDASSDYQKIVDRSWDKVSVYRNENNLGCYLNKLKVLSYLEEDEWCILFDSDNSFGRPYIDPILNEDVTVGLNKNTAYLPTIAGSFNYDFMSGITVTPTEWNEKFRPCHAEWNTCNFLLHSSLAKKILETKTTYYDDILPYNKDACFINFLIARSKGDIKFVPDMKYEHRIHDQGHNYFAEEDQGNSFFEIWDWNL